MVQALPAGTAVPALCVAVRLGTAWRGPRNAQPFATEYPIKPRRELAIAIVEEDRHRQGAHLDVPAHLPGLLGEPGCGRVLGAAGEIDPTGAHLDEEEHNDGA